jgi:hypothetical protein
MYGYRLHVCMVTKTQPTASSTQTAEEAAATTAVVMLNRNHNRELFFAVGKKKKGPESIRRFSGRDRHQNSSELTMVILGETGPNLYTPEATVQSLLVYVENHTGK